MSSKSEQTKNSTWVHSSVLTIGGTLPINERQGECEERPNSTLFRSNNNNSFETSGWLKKGRTQHCSDQTTKTLLRLLVG